MSVIALSCTAQTIDEVKRELHRQKVPHAHIVLAQARLETGNFKSRLCRSHKNLFGIKHNGRYARYKHWKDSIADYKKCISSRYEGGNYLAFLRRIGYFEDANYEKKIRKIIRTSK